ASILKYQSAREVLEAHLRYDGVLNHSTEVKLAIPYTLSADLDYTRATIVAQRILISSGKNEMRLQGKISQVLSSDISGKLDYTGKFEVPFLHYFFADEKFAGNGAASGSLEFSREKFFTQGHFTSEGIDFEGWHTANITSDYTYHFPDRRLTVRNLKNTFMEGSVSGDLTVENLPGPSRVVLNLNYANVNAASVVGG